MKYFEAKGEYVASNKTTKFELLVDAQTFTEGEAKVIQCLTGRTFEDGEKGHSVDINAMKKSRISEVYDEQEGVAFFQCKLTWHTVSENGNDKDVSELILMKANTPKHAEELIDDLGLDHVDMEVVEIKKTKIDEVYESGVF